MTFKIFSNFINLKYHKIVNTISFYPIVIAIFFLLVSFIMIKFDFSELGIEIKSNIKWLRLKDASTARSIISSITAGVISLTVFSFSMVMIVLNQAASQMTNRVLDNLIGNRFQQMVLGVYIGTVVYSLFVLSTIRDIDSGIYIPSLSVYLLIALTIIDIFLFIYFLNYITNSVKYQTIIHSIYEQTLAAMKNSCLLNREPDTRLLNDPRDEIKCNTTGIYQGFDRAELINLCKQNNILISFSKPTGTFLIKGSVVARVSREIDDSLKELIYLHINIKRENQFVNNYHYGINQLVEVAVKALSPGVNDPGTAVQSLRALTALLVFHLENFPDNVLLDENFEERIFTCERKFEEIFNRSILPIWEYGKNDIIFSTELLNILLQLRPKCKVATIQKIIDQINSQASSNRDSS